MIIYNYVFSVKGICGFLSPIWRSLQVNIVNWTFNSWNTSREIQFLKYIFWNTVLEIHLLKYISWNTSLEIHLLKYIFWNTSLDIHLLKYICWKIFYFRNCFYFAPELDYAWECLIHQGTWIRGNSANINSPT